MPTPPLRPIYDRAKSFPFLVSYWPLLPLACGTLLSTLLFFMALDDATWAAWSSFFPFALQPVFHDLAVTLQHLHEADRGLDPLSDPHSEFAYPRAVLLLRFLGLHHIPTAWLGLAQGIALTAAVVFVLRPNTPRRAVAATLLFFTPPFRLGLERGNLDFALFVICAAAAWQWARSGRRRKLAWPVTAAISAALLKLYPIFALAGGALAETGRRRIIWLGAIAVVIGYWCLDSTELALILGKFPVSTGAAWGCLVFFARVERFAASHPELFGWSADLSWSLVGVTLYLGAATAAAFLGLRLAPHFAAVRIPRLEWTNYWVGALICCGSFLTANLAYRWIFVLLTLPLLLRCMRSTHAIVALWSRSAVAAVLISLAAPLDASGLAVAVIHAANWLCVLLFICGCTALRVTAKSPLFAYLLRLCAPPPATVAAPVAPQVARVPSR